MRKFLEQFRGKPEKPVQLGWDNYWLWTRQQAGEVSMAKHLYDMERAYDPFNDYSPRVHPLTEAIRQGALTDADEYRQLLGQAFPPGFESKEYLGPRDYLWLHRESMSPLERVSMGMRSIFNVQSRFNSFER